MDNKNNSKPKMKAAKKVKEEVEAKVAQTKSDVVENIFKEEPKSIPVPSFEEEETDDSALQCQTESPPPDVPESPSDKNLLMKMAVADISFGDFCMGIETAFLTTMNQREENRKKENAEYIRQQRAKGREPITTENALVKCADYLKVLVETYNLYKTHNSAIDKQQAQSKAIADEQSDTVKRLETVVGKIEKVQGVKAPIRPPFPSWACLTFLFWHWPMYAFSYCWQSKYFRRFCFLVAFFVMIIEFCLIVLLAYDNRAYHNERIKYNIVRNWSYVLEDSAAMKRFDKVDLLFEDVEFNREKIMDIGNMIQTKNEELQKKKRRKW